MWDFHCWRCRRVASDETRCWLRAALPCGHESPSSTRHLCRLRSGISARESPAKPRLQADGLPVISLDVKHSEAQHISSSVAVQRCETSRAGLHVFGPHLNPKPETPKRSQQLLEKRSGYDLPLAPGAGFLGGSRLKLKFFRPLFPLRGSESPCGFGRGTQTGGLGGKSIKLDHTAIICYYYCYDDDDDDCYYYVLYRILFICCTMLHYLVFYFVCMMPLA